MYLFEDEYNNVIRFIKVNNTMLAAELYKNGNGNIRVIPNIESVEFDNPVTRVTFDDKTHARAKCHGEDTFGKEKGLAICLAKRAYGIDFVREAFEKWCNE